MHESISFGTWLRQQRRALDLTQKAFADQIGCAEITVRRMEADAVGSVVIGWLVYRVLRSLSERRRYTLERLRLIATLNHHIRNSLQVIQLSAQTTQHDGAIRHIDDSVQRITSVLADIIPMPDADPHLPVVEQRRPPQRA